MNLGPDLNAKKLNFLHKKIDSWLSLRGLRFYPLGAAFLRISGLLESLDCPSDWFVGVAEEGAMPKNQLEEPD